MKPAAEKMTIERLMLTLQIRIQGIVQGVGFRPTIWRYAKDHNITGQVSNDGNGVLIIAQGYLSQCDLFINKIKNSPPPLARIDRIETNNVVDQICFENFEIVNSHRNRIDTAISPDVATCQQCLNDVIDPSGRRFRYPLTNCTHCGPRFSIIRALPYDRTNTSMHEFEQCAECKSEYQSPEDRRFHAQPNCCPNCGPVVELVRLDGKPIYTDAPDKPDDVEVASTLLRNGEILAVKGIGGFHLACDATDEQTVARLRKIKQRQHKPFALMARDINVIKHHAIANQQQLLLLGSIQAPVVLLNKIDKPPITHHQTDNHDEIRLEYTRPVADSVAPGINQLGFMLPYTPLHQLLLRRINRPVVLTSANISGHSQIIDNNQIVDKFKGKVDYALWHQRDIVNRVDDSVVQFSSGTSRTIRRSRGYAPMSLPLPAGFERSVDLTAFGAELKNTFCFIKRGQLVLSQHIGDLKNLIVHEDYKTNIHLYNKLYQHTPKKLVADLHPQYLSTKYAEQCAQTFDLPLQSVQHHHAHVASCLFENNRPLEAKPVLGIVLDGLGYGWDDTLWGGEFLLADYVSVKRLATFKPVHMIGGSQASLEPWRNCYAHLNAGMGWAEVESKFKGLELIAYLKQKPIKTLDAMVKQSINSPLTSSCGRLFDAVSAAVGVCRENNSYEGQAAMELESLIDKNALFKEDDSLAYSFSVVGLTSSLAYIEPVLMWKALLNDMTLKIPVPIMAARFHKGLANTLVLMALRLCEKHDIETVALSGGVFQNSTLLELVITGLETNKLKVLTHSQIPANDGGIAVGQAVIGAANSILQDGRQSCA